MMQTTRFPVAIVALLASLCLFLGLSLPAFAHGRANVGDYELVIGFKNEPAYQGEPNGLDLRVTNTKTGEKVKGLEKTLKAEIVRGSARKALTIRAQFGVDGAYTADVLPSEAGDYTWHIFGAIENTPVDISMTSSPTTFNSVQTKSGVAFPGVEPTAAELHAQSDAAMRTARIALGAGAAGVLLGLVGLAYGVAARRSRRPTVGLGGEERATSQA